MTGPSEDPTQRNPRPVPKTSTAPSEPRLAYSETADPPAPRTDRIARGAGRVTPPRRTATPPAQAPHALAPRPHPGHGPHQHRPAPTARPAHQPAPHPAQRPAPPAAQPPPQPAQHAAQPAPQRTRPRLTGPEWAAAAAMIVLALAVVLGLALA